MARPRQHGALRSGAPLLDDRFEIDPTATTAARRHAAGDLRGLTAIEVR
jgi:hypothetical protein